VIEAESWAVLKALTKYNFQDAFKKMEEALGMVHTCRSRLFEGDGGL
jgi:hypothetical protein